MKKATSTPIPGWEGLYSITGDLKIISHPKKLKFGSTKEREVKTYMRTGYPCVDLYRRGVRTARSVHSIVCEVFVGPRPSESHQVNHKNGIRSDYSIRNLEWVTAGENVRHAYKTGLKKRPIGTRNPRAKLDNKSVIAIRSECRAGNKQADVANKHGVSRALVSFIHQRKAWRHVA